MSWQEDRRRDRAARAEQARADAVAAAQVETMRAQAAAEARRADAELAAQLRRDADRDRRAAQDADRDRRQRRSAARRAAVRVWVSAHVVDLLIYPLALVSAVMAIPAMAEFGHDVYGSAAGYALPVITELGMWAFAVAVQAARVQDRPAWALQLGVYCFAAIAFGLNTLHGLGTTWLDGVVMGVASVAGVTAHQLVSAAPRRGRADRDAERLAHRAHRKIVRVRRAAIDTAVAEIDQDGHARLLIAPGRYRRGRRGLEPAVVPGLPVDPALDTPWDELDRDLTRLLTADLPPHLSGRAEESTPDRGRESGSTGGGVGTLDHPADLQESRASRPTSPDPDEPVGGRPGRSLTELHAELRAAVESGSVDPTSAESIRRSLRCGAHRARQLRDEYRNESGRSS